MMLRELFADFMQPLTHSSRVQLWRLTLINQAVEAGIKTLACPEIAVNASQSSSKLGVTQSHLIPLDNHA